MVFVAPVATQGCGEASPAEPVEAQGVCLPAPEPIATVVAVQNQQELELAGEFPAELYADKLATIIDEHPEIPAEISMTAGERYVKLFLQGGEMAAKFWYFYCQKYK